jgi:hypothetical protein
MFSFFSHFSQSRIPSRPEVSCYSFSQEPLCPIVESLSLRDRVRPYLIIALLALLFFADLVLHPTSTLYSDHSDLLAMHLPLKRFLVRSWQETGEIPLWNPYSFGGMPFIHDVQVAAFYPFHSWLYFVPEERVGAALSWIVVLHVMIAGWCMYSYAKSKKLDSMSSLVAASGYMFAGKWLLHILSGGHYIMTPLAWLPAVLLCLERSIKSKSPLQAIWAGGFYSLIILGTHPQMTLYAGIFVALWSLACAWDTGSVFDPTDPARQRVGWKSFVARWLFMGLWTALIAAALSAVQLLPAVEAARESSRAAGVGVHDIFLAAIPSILGLFGTGLTQTWEDRANLGVIWVAAAVVAPLLCRGRPRYEGFACLALIAFALGGAALVQGLPGFRLFQLPVRMLMLLALPIALLAGRTTQILLDNSPDTPKAKTILHKVLPRVFVISLFLAAMGTVLNYLSWQRSAVPGSMSSFSEWLEQLDLRSQSYWPVLFLEVVATLWLLSKRCTLNSKAWGRMWLGVLLADCWAFTATHVAVKPESEIYTPSECVRHLAEKRAKEPNEHWRVLDPGLPGKPADAPLGAALPLLGDNQLEAILGYNSFDVRRYKEFLQFIHGEDRPLLPRDGIFGYPIIADFTIENQHLLDLLNVRYLLQPAGKSRSFENEGGHPQRSGWHLVDEKDPHPRAYSFLTGGLQELPPYVIYENQDCFPRAFKVSRAIPLADRPHVFDQLKSTDFRQEVLLEGARIRYSAAIESRRPFIPAKIEEYFPNRVVIATSGDDPGILVLTDLWFPGWNCQVDGKPADVLRANFLFRAVMVPGGNHEVTFLFAPESYSWGRLISLAALAFFLVASYFAFNRLSPRCSGGRPLCRSNGS